MKRYGITAALCFGIFVLRAWERLRFYELWAEDGDTLFYEVSRLGWRSFLNPEFGIYLTLQKLIVGIGWLVTATYLPLFVCLVCLGIAALIVAAWTRDTYEWIVPNPTVRIVGSVLVCLAPGTAEILGNAANIQSYLLLWLSLLGLKNPKDDFKAWEIATIFVSVFSMGTFIVLVPLYVFRLLRRRQVEWGVVIAFALAFGVNLLTATRVFADTNLILRSIPTLLFSYIVRGLWTQPWLGDWVTVRLSDPHLKFWQGLVELAFVVFVVWGIKKHWKEARVKAITVFLGGLCMWPILSWLARPDSLPRFGGVSSIFWLDRYAFPLGFASVLLWSVVLSRRPKWFYAFAALCIALNCYRFKVPAYGLERRWESGIREMKAIDGVVVFPGYPEGYSVRFVR